MLLADGRHRGQSLLTPTSVEAMTTNHLTAPQRAGGEMILGRGRDWGYGMSVFTDTIPGQPAAGSFWAGSGLRQLVDQRSLEGSDACLSLGSSAHCTITECRPGAAAKCSRALHRSAPDRCYSAHSRMRTFRLKRCLAALVGCM